MKFQDYYEVLGVARNASEDEIKKAYTKLALKWHPDRHQGADRADAEAKFKQVNEAKEVLLDPEKRKKYDRFGKDWEHGQEFTPRGGNGHRVSPEEFEQMFGGAGFSDFFASMFGDDMAAQFNRRRPRRTRGADVNAELSLTVSDAVAGGKRTFALGTVSTCAACDGQGEFEDGHVCPTCAGLGRTRGQKTVELAIPRNVANGMKLRLRGLGEAGERGGEAGDLYLTLNLTSDDVYRVNGSDLEADLPIAPWEAIEGAKVEVRTLDGTATLSVPAGTTSGAKLRMRGLGLGNNGGRGDFYAIIRYALPENLTDRQRELIRQMKGGEVKGGARK